MKNPNDQYYKTPSKSQNQNPNLISKSQKFGSIGIYLKFGIYPKVGSIGIWNLFGSIGTYLDLGFSINRRFL